jgi:beta-lactam-binding protein with PASTA domain
LLLSIFIITGCGTKKEINNNEEKKEEKERVEKEESDTDNKIELPDVSGMKLEAAIRKIQQAGFINFFYGTREIESDVYSGLVVKTSPPAGSKFSRKNKLNITFYISK